MSFFDKVKAKINKKINPENIILIDNSQLHSKHKSFDLTKLHLKIIIKSKKLNLSLKALLHKILKKLSADENFCVGRCQVRSDFKKFSISF